MKLSAAILALATIGSAAAKTITAKTAHKLIRSARHLEEAAEEEAAEEEEEEQDEFAFLGNYSVKMVGCTRELAQPLVNEEGEYEYSAVLLRLCPSSGGCDSTTEMGCKNGYGEMLVGLNTFVEAFMEDQEEEQGDDGNGFEVGRYAKCEEYNPDDNADDQNAGAWENYQFFVGPTCTDDGIGLKLELFTDEGCTAVSEDIDFESISNGWTLPYSDGGLVSTYCNSCTEYNDNGEAEIKEMCKRPYEEAAYKCEEGMEFYSYYGQNVQGCETIEEVFPSTKGSAGKTFGWIVLAACVVGLGGYVVWWRKRKATSIE